MEHNHIDHASHASFWKSGYSVAMLIIGSFGLYFLMTRHFAHVVDALPYLLLLACPLMHVFMHHGHGGHAGHGSDEKSVGKPNQSQGSPTEKS